MNTHYKMYGSPPLFGSSITVEKPPVMALAKVRFSLEKTKTLKNKCTEWKITEVTTVSYFHINYCKFVVNIV